MKQELAELKRETDISKIIIGDFNILLSVLIEYLDKNQIKQRI